VARLVADPASDAAGFLGLTMGGRYGSDAQAMCEVLSGALPPPRRWGRRRVPASHSAPAVGCSCGFYAYRDRRDAEKLLATHPPVGRHFGTALLDVDLAGTVIEYDHGFRSSHQRVLGVRVPAWCLPCASAGRARRASQLAGQAGEPLAAALQSEIPAQPQVYRLARTLHHQALLARIQSWAALRPVCDDHMPTDGAHLDHRDPPTTVRCAPADLAARLGTEVSWLVDGFDVATYIDTLSWASVQSGYTG
jgi:hypothetical protein